MRHTVVIGSYRNEQKRSNGMNLANKLTLSRIIAVPFVMAALLMDNVAYNLELNISQSSDCKQISCLDNFYCGDHHKPL